MGTAAASTSQEPETHSQEYSHRAKVQGPGLLGVEEWGLSTPPPCSWRLPDDVAKARPGQDNQSRGKIYYKVRALVGPMIDLLLSQQQQQQIEKHHREKRNQVGPQVLQPMALFSQKCPAQCHTQHEFPSFLISYSGGCTQISKTFSEGFHTLTQ